MPELPQARQFSIKKFSGMVSILLELKLYANDLYALFFVTAPHHLVILPINLPEIKPVWSELMILGKQVKFYWQQY